MGKIDRLIMRIVAILVAGVVLITIYWLPPDKPVAVTIVVFAVLWMDFTFALVLAICSLFIGYAPGRTGLGKRRRDKTGRPEPLSRDVSSTTIRSSGI